MVTGIDRVLLQGVTEGYKGLQGVTMGYRGLQGVTSGYKNNRGLQRTTNVTPG